MTTHPGPATKEEQLIPPTFDRYHVVLLMRGPQAANIGAADVDRLQREHLAYLKGLYRTGDLLAMGPFQVSDTERLRGIMLFSASIPQERVRELVGSDPSVKAGKLSYELLLWMTPGGALSIGPRNHW